MQYTDGQTVKPVVETDRVKHLSEGIENIVRALVIPLLLAVTGNNTSQMNSVFIQTEINKLQKM
jgi:hypothetical protein